MSQNRTMHFLVVCEWSASIGRLHLLSSSSQVQFSLDTADARILVRVQMRCFHTIYSIQEHVNWLGVRIMCFCRKLLDGRTIASLCREKSCSARTSLLVFRDGLQRCLLNYRRCSSNHLNCQRYFTSDYIKFYCK